MISTPPVQIVGVEEVRVLDHGFVRLDSAMATDLSVVNAARVSFGLRKEIVDEKDETLIKYLMDNRHGTPFEHNSFRFHVKAPLFVVREWQRHRMASYNELSGRYKQFENPDFYLPDPENIRTQIGKPGNYTFARWPGNHKNLRSVVLRHYQDSMDLYEWMINSGVAKEQARIVLPLALYTEFYVTQNARSLMNFLSLRNAPEALWEIQEYAKILEESFVDCMPLTAQAFIANNRIAP